MKDHARQKFLLTERQAEVFRFISERPEATFQEIADRFKFTVGTVQVYVRALVKKGYLKDIHKVSRFEIL